MFSSAKSAISAGASLMRSLNPPVSVREPSEPSASLGGVVVPSPAQPASNVTLAPTPSATNSRRRTPSVGVSCERSSPVGRALSVIVIRWTAPIRVYPGGARLGFGRFYPVLRSDSPDHGAETHAGGYGPATSTPAASTTRSASRAARSRTAAASIPTCSPPSYRTSPSTIVKTTSSPWAAYTR